MTHDLFIVWGVIKRTKLQPGRFQCCPRLETFSLLRFQKNKKNIFQDDDFHSHLRSDDAYLFNGRVIGRT